MTPAVDLQAAIAAAHPDLAVTLDPETAAAALSSSDDVTVLVQAGLMTLDTHNHMTAELKVHLIAGPPEHPLAAWATLDDTLAALLPDTIDADTIELTAFPNPSGPPWPALTITTTTHYHEQETP